MDSKSRMLKAWRFEEPDRVPIEMYVSPNAEGLPGYDELKEFERNEADNFRYIAGFDLGFFGLDYEDSEEVIEDVPGDFKRILRVRSTPAGDFTAVTRHLCGEIDKGDFYWEKNYIDTIDDLRRVMEADHSIPRPFMLDDYNRGCAEVGNRGLPVTIVYHPLGELVRKGNMEEVYTWMIDEEEFIMEFLEACNDQVSESVLSLINKPLASPPIFKTGALEMLTPPWMGKEQFIKFVFPFDKQVNDAIHKIGGRHNAHCHGNSGRFLEMFADMGIDAIEPLEPAPYADNVLFDAKRSVGNRMLLCGNIPSQAFYSDKVGPEHVRQWVKAAIQDGAPGGGFSLRMTGGCGNGKNKAQQIKSLECGLAMVAAWREFGSY